MSDDRQLGMDRSISRRDFLNGAAVGMGGTLAAGALPDAFVKAAALERAIQAAVYYPPTRTGMRGSHDLLGPAKAHADVVKIYQRRTEGEWGVGIDAEPALDCWGMGYQGFAGLGLGAPAAGPSMSYTAAGYASGGSYRFHYPDGNASIARLLVRELIPKAMPGHSAEDIVTSVADYSQLDRPESAVRIRLNSTVVRVRHAGDSTSAQEVEITYASGKQVFTARGKNVVMACWNMMIPFLVPDLPAAQKDALQYLTVNRWPHGYGYEYNPLYDPQWPTCQAPHEIGAVEELLAKK
jgi:hypothetical protein